MPQKYEITLNLGLDLKKCKENLLPTKKYLTVFVTDTVFTEGIKF